MKKKDVGDDTETLMKTLMIDPPSGWLYGFPKPLKPEDIDPFSSFDKWLVANGYPEKDALWASEHCRSWEIEE